MLDATGTSVYGEVGGRAIPAAWTGGVARRDAARFGAQRNTNDIVADRSLRSPGFAIGRLDDDDAARVRGADARASRGCSTSRHPTCSCRTTTSSSAGRASTGNALAGFPQVTSDMAFFVTPAIADLDGDGANEVDRRQRRSTCSVRTTATGDRPAGWPKLTGGWLVGTPGLGDWDGDGEAELAVVASRRRACSCGTPRRRDARSPSGRAAAATTATPACTGG